MCTLGGQAYVSASPQEVLCFTSGCEVELALQDQLLALDWIAIGLTLPSAFVLAERESTLQRCVFIKKYLCPLGASVVFRLSLATP